MKSQKIEPVVAYLRTSQSGELGRNDLEDQKYYIDSYLIDKPLRISRYYIDAGSKGMITDSPELLKMFKALKKDQKPVIVDEIGRFSDDITFQELIIKDIKALGGSIIGEAADDFEFKSDAFRNCVRYVSNRQDAYMIRTREIRKIF
jgi:DNA invertase Pin-like site-specific DNA recombinase